MATYIFLFELPLALAALVQISYVIWFLFTNGHATAVILAPMLVLVGVISALPMIVAVAKPATFAAAIVLSLFIAFMFRRQLGAFSLFEMVGNHMVDLESGRRIPFERGRGVPYISNTLMLLAFMANYFYFDTRVVEIISVLAFMALIPIFAIKLIGEKRF